MPEDIIEWAKGVKERIAYELEHRGSEAPCPFCGLPRCERSDYIRCSRCGINWCEGDNLDIHPHLSKVQKQAHRLGSEAKVPGVRGGVRAVEEFEPGEEEGREQRGAR